MRIIRRALCALLLGPASAAHADFSWELAGLLGQAERSDVNQGFRLDFDSDLVGVSGTYYFDPVEDGTGPLALAAFLEPATHLSVAATEERTTSQTYDPFAAPLSRIESDTREHSLRGVYLLAASKWYAGGRYSLRDTRDPERSPPPPPSTITVTSSIESDLYGLVAGKYFGSGATRLDLAFDRSKVETELELTFCAAACVTNRASNEAITDTTRLDVKYVGRFRSATYALLGGIREIEGRISSQGTTFPGPLLVEPEPLHAYSVGAELYPVPAIGVRLGYTSTEGADLDSEDGSLSASWFFRPRLAVELTLSRQDSDLLPRTDRSALTVIGRF